MTDALQAAGFTRVRVSDEPVEGGLRDPMLVVRYRTGLAQLRSFVVGLDPDRHAAFLVEAADAVVRTGEVLAPVVVEAVARA